MKLPENKKERMQMLGMGAAVGIAAIYALVAFGIKPILNSKKAKETRIVELNEEIAKADRTINASGADRKFNIETIKKILAITDTHILKPGLGDNYQLGAEAIVEKHARKAKVNLKESKFETRGLGVKAIPKVTNRRESNALNFFVLRIIIEAGYHDVVRFVREIESANPYLAVVSLSIVDIPKQPELHKITMDIQWPVLAEPELDDELRAQLKQLDDNSETSGGLDD